MPDYFTEKIPVSKLGLGLFDTRIEETYKWWRRSGGNFNSENFDKLMPIVTMSSLSEWDMDTSPPIIHVGDQSFIAWAYKQEDVESAGQTPDELMESECLAGHFDVANNEPYLAIMKIPINSQFGLIETTFERLLLPIYSERGLNGSICTGSILTTQFKEFSNSEQQNADHYRQASLKDRFFQALYANP